MENLVGRYAQSASLAVVGKAEHLKILLIEWMKRMDGPNKYYSDNKYNFGIGIGDVGEIRRRRNWRTVPFWISDMTEITFGPAVLIDGSNYVRNEYLYIGRTTEGTLAIRGVAMSGNDAAYFTIGQIVDAAIEQNQYN